MEIKENCHWHSNEPRPRCGILSELVCKNKKCSFYETEKEFKKRQEAFEKKHGRSGESKLCKKCGVVKSIEEFGRNLSSADGREYVCLECRREQSRKIYTRRKETL